jgi:NAD(P)-dependent dehydrogenase (short-subunit alcohol dehydrogenase family)
LHYNWLTAPRVIANANKRPILSAMEMREFAMPSVAVVTGSRSGIGLATVDHLRGQGWTVIGLDTANARETGPDAMELYCDVGSAASVDHAIASVAARYGRINALICSAGVLRIGSFETMDVEAFDLLFAVNTRGPFLCARAAIPLLRPAAAAGETARIVFVGSISGLRPKVGSGAYAASKAALHTLAGVLAAELGPARILVNAVAPGTVDTPMMAGIGTGAPQGGFRPSGASPLGRIAVPGDVVPVIDFLLSDAAAYVTGVVLPVDGGTRAAFVPPG